MPQWQDITLGQVAVLGAVLVAIVALLGKLWPPLRRLTQVVDALEGLPQTVSDMTDAVDQVKALNEQVKQIHHEVTPNSGGSIKDAVARLERGQQVIEQGQRRHDGEVAGIRAELRDARREISTVRGDVARVQERVDELPNEPSA